MSKKPIVRRRKRPKSVMKRAWETRRAKQKELRDFVGHKTYDKMKQGLSSTMAIGAADVSGANQASPIPPSDHAVLHTLEIQRNEQLCAFMGDLFAIRQSQPHNHMPLMISRPQIEAIESFLDEHGFTPWGRKPAQKAA